MMKSLRLTFLLAAAACSILGAHYLSIDTADGSGIFVDRKVGDTVSFVAIQWVYTNSTDAADPESRSDTHPSRYTWSSDDPAIIEMVAPGRFFMKSAGQTRIRVKTRRDETSTLITIK